MKELFLRDCDSMAWADWSNFVYVTVQGHSASAFCNAIGGIFDTLNQAMWLGVLATRSMRARKCS